MNETTQYATVNEQAKQVALQIEVMANELTDYKVQSNEDLELAAEKLKEVKGKSKELTEMRLSMTRPLDDSKKRIMDFFRRPLDILASMEKTIKFAALNYQQEQERIRQEQERKLQEAARKEEEKKRAQLETRAQKAEEKGNPEKAQELREKQADVFVPAPTLQSTVVKPKGIATKKIWKYRIVDEAAIPRKYLIPNEKMLGELARATRGVVEIAGVEFYAEDTLAARI